MIVSLSRYGGLFGLLLLMGCSSEKTPADLIAESNQTNLQRIANLYMRFQAAHSWKGPKDEATFKSFIQNTDVPSLQAMGVDPNNLDKLFTSERDNQPFKVRYGVSGGMGVSSPVVFEQGGTNGKKQVGFTNNVQEETDESRYAELIAGKGDAKGGAKGRPPAGAMGNRPVGPPPGATTKTGS